MTPRLLLICFIATFLCTGCTKSLGAGNTDRHGQMDFHARGMIVPDFNSGSSTVTPVKCRQATRLTPVFIRTDG